MYFRVPQANLEHLVVQEDLEKRYVVNSYYCNLTGTVLVMFQAYIDFIKAAVNSQK